MCLTLAAETSIFRLLIIPRGVEIPGADRTRASASAAPFVLRFDATYRVVQLTFTP